MTVPGRPTAHTQDATHPKTQGLRDSLHVSQEEAHARLGSQECGHGGLLPARASIWRGPVSHLVHLLQEQVLAVHHASLLQCDVWLGQQLPALGVAHLPEASLSLH